MDERVASAVANWAPRFTTNGVAVADFQRVTASVERWEDWCSAWSEAATVHADLGREALSEGRTRSAGAHFSTAAVYYHFGKFLFVEHPDEMREAHRRAVACLTEALPHLDPPGERVEIPFEGSTLVGILRRLPDHADEDIAAGAVFVEARSVYERVKTLPHTVADVA